MQLDIDWIGLAKRLRDQATILTTGPRDIRLSSEECLALVDLITNRLNRQLDGWQPIESAPRDGTRIHLGFPHMAGFDVIAHWTDGDWSSSGSGPDADRLHGRPAPTHWQPLPEPPR